MSTEKHKKKAPLYASIAIISVSSTRSIKEDESGAWIKTEAEKKGHTVCYHGVADDDALLIKNNIIEVIENKKPNKKPDAIIVTGGTGIAPKDVTIEAVSPLFEKELTAFGVIFAKLSFDEIGASAILSRAAAGIFKNCAIFCIPGSIKACKLACESIIFKEIGHIIKHIREK
jgi:molybdopterin adenylyltransferase